MANLFCLKRFFFKRSFLYVNANRTYQIKNILLFYVLFKMSNVFINLYNKIFFEKTAFFYINANGTLRI